MGITALDIPKEKWRAYFDLISEECEGWATTVEVLLGTLGDQAAMDGLPLAGISVETAGSQAGDILIEAGDVGTAFETHLVHRPCLVRVASTQPGAENDIEITNEDGLITLVRLRIRSALPSPTEM